jgi:hypothetical protein
MVATYAMVVVRAATTSPTIGIVFSYGLKFIAFHVIFWLRHKGKISFKHGQLEDFCCCIE